MNLIKSTVFFMGATLVGCSHMNVGELVESFQYTPDTPILIDDTPYQINTIKCAEIRSIEPNGALNCYDADGTRSAKMTPIPNFRRKSIEEKIGDSWASPAHIAYLYYYFHLGGKEENEKQLGQAVSGLMAASSTLNLLDSIERAQEYETETFKRNAKGVGIYNNKGFDTWMTYQDSLIDWHLKNANYFFKEAN